MLICFGSNSMNDKQTVIKMPGKLFLLSSIKLKSIFKNPLTCNNNYLVKQERRLQLKNIKWHFIKSTLHITNISLIGRNIQNSNNGDSSDKFNNDDDDIDNEAGDDMNNDDGDTNEDGGDDEKFGNDGGTNDPGDNDDGGDDEKCDDDDDDGDGNIDNGDDADNNGSGWEDSGNGEGPGDSNDEGN